MKIIILRETSKAVSVCGFVNLAGSVKEMNTRFLARRDGTASQLLALPATRLPMVCAEARFRPATVDQVLNMW